MNIFEMLIVNMIFLSYPLFLYTLYVVANKNVTREEKTRLFDFVLLSSSFLVLHFGHDFLGDFTSFSLGGIVFLALFKERYGISFLLAAITVFSYVPDGSAVLYYTLCYGVFLFTVYIYSKGMKTKKGIDILYLISYSMSYWIWNFSWNWQFFLSSFIFILSFLLLFKLLALLIASGETLMKNHLEFKELQQERQIQNSLFKITHEIKNPVAVCKAYLDMFDVENQEHARKYIPILQSEIERLLVLLQDFLLVNKANMKYEIMDMNMLLEDVSRKMKPVMEEKKIHFVVDILDDELFINGDYNRLNQVMMNVLKNSIEANAMKITLRTHLTSKVIEVYVEDNGEGFSNEIASRMFEPFYTTKSYGTGLGVSLSNEIIHAHHGKLEYISKEGVGTSVKITLPLYLL